MKRILLTLITAALLAGCASTGNDGTNLREAEAAALYETAKRAMDRGDWTTATEELEALQAQYPFGVYATQAQLDIIQVYYEAGDVASTVAAAERFRRIHPRHRAVPYSWYMQGVALQEKNDDFIKRLVGVDTTLRDPVPRRQAFQSFNTILERYPDSRYAEDAEARIRELYANGARYQLHVAQFYADRRAWVASARRATMVIEEFPNTPAVEPAMSLLAQAYRELALDDLADGVVAAADEQDMRLSENPEIPPLYQDQSFEVPPSPSAGGASGAPGGSTVPGPDGGGIGGF